jgi:hypothetical protein
MQRCLKIPIRVAAAPHSFQEAQRVPRGDSCCEAPPRVSYGSDSDLGPRLSLVRSSLNNGHAATTAACPKSANRRHRSQVIVHVLCATFSYADTVCQNCRITVFGLPCHHSVAVPRLGVDEGVHQHPRSPQLEAEHNEPIPL